MCLKSNHFNINNIMCEGAHYYLLWKKNKSQKVWQALY